MEVGKDRRREWREEAFHILLIYTSKESHSLLLELFGKSDKGSGSRRGMRRERRTGQGGESVRRGGSRGGSRRGSR